MNQDHSYPDPAQLRAYAGEPMPFTEVGDLSLSADARLVGGVGQVVYKYRPAYIRFTPEEGEPFEVAQHDAARLDHAGCWTRAEDVLAEEDYVEVTGYTSDMVPEHGLFEAFWRLEEVTIRASH